MSNKPSFSRSEPTWDGARPADSPQPQVTPQPQVPPPAPAPPQARAFAPARRAHAEVQLEPRNRSEPSQWQPTREQSPSPRQGPRRGGLRLVLALVIGLAVVAVLLAAMGLVARAQVQRAEAPPAAVATPLTPPAGARR